MNAALLLLLAEVPAFGFSSGVRALDIGADAHSVRAAACADCHEEQTAAWARSRHRVSITNPIFAAGFNVEPEARCVRCHSPLPEQIAETARSLRTKTERPADALAHEGVTCAVCHVRDGDAHNNHELQSNELCGSCHQFEFHEKKQGELVLKDLLIQSTYAEWNRYRARGGEGTCISCHMKDGTHDIRGAHDLELLRQSLDVRIDGRTMVLTSRGVGHHFPTGDVFRHVTIEVEDPRGWTEVHRLGRLYKANENADGSHSMVLAADTALRPDEPTTIELPEDAIAYRIRYRYTRAGDVFREVESGMLTGDGRVRPTHRATLNRY